MFVIYINDTGSVSLRNGGWFESVKVRTTQGCSGKNDVKKYSQPILSQGTLKRKEWVSSDEAIQYAKVLGERFENVIHDSLRNLDIVIMRYRIQVIDLNTEKVCHIIHEYDYIR